MVVRMPSPVVLPWSLILCGGSHGSAVTTLSLACKALAHMIGLPRAFFFVLTESRTRILLASPWVERSISPGFAPPIFSSVSCTPARWSHWQASLGRKQLLPQLTPSPCGSARSNQHRRARMRRRQRAVKIIVRVKNERVPPLQSLGKTLALHPAITALAAMDSKRWHDPARRHGQERLVVAMCGFYEGCDFRFRWHHQAEIRHPSPAPWRNRSSVRVEIFQLKDLVSRDIRHRSFLT